MLMTTRGLCSWARVPKVSRNFGAKQVLRSFQLWWELYDQALDVLFVILCFVEIRPGPYYALFAHFGSNHGVQSMGAWHI